MARQVQSIAARMAALVLVLLALPAWAVDGVVLIDQNRALAGGVTPGDAAGFPVTISQSGSYRLSGNLVVPDGNTTAIEITANHVTLDLNGFAILGPVDCTSVPCANAGLQLGHGVLAGSDSPVRTFFDIAVRNGTISGMGADGVHLLGDNLRVEELRVRDSGLSGIVVRSTGLGSQQTNVIVRGNAIQRTGGYGIKVESGLVAGNVVDACRSTGIAFTSGVGTAARNVVTACGELGLRLTSTVSYTGNTLVDNNAGGAQVAGGINTGQNICNNAICAGAVY